MRPRHRANPSDARERCDWTRLFRAPLPPQPPPTPPAMPPPGASSLLTASTAALFSSALALIATPSSPSAPASAAAAPRRCSSSSPSARHRQLCPLYLGPRRASRARPTAEPRARLPMGRLLAVSILSEPGEPAHARQNARNCALLAFMHVMSSSAALWASAIALHIIFRATCGAGMHRRPNCTKGTIDQMVPMERLLWRTALTCGVLTRPARRAQPPTHAAVVFLGL